MQKKIDKKTISIFGCDTCKGVWQLKATLVLLAFLFCIPFLPSKPVFAIDAPVHLPVEVQTKKGQFMLRFKWPGVIDNDVKIDKNRVYIHFKKPTTINIYKLRQEASQYLQPINVKETTKDLRLSFKVPAKARVEKVELAEGLIFIIKTPLAKPSKPKVSPPSKQKSATKQDGKGKKANLKQKPKTRKVKKVVDGVEKEIEEIIEDIEDVSVEPEQKGIPVTLDFQEGGFSLAFNWSKDVGAAVWNQGASVWLVFSDASLLNTQRLRELRKRYISDYQIIGIQGGQIVKLVFHTPFYAVPKRNGTAWTFEFTKAPSQSINPLSIDETIGQNNLLALRFFVKDLEDLQADKLLKVSDEHGNPLYVLTFKLPGVAVTGGRKYPDFNLFQTQQGLVLMQKIDGLKIYTDPNYVEVYHDRGLLLSPTSERLFQPKKAYVPYFFKFKDWVEPQKTINQIKNDYMSSLLKATGDEKNILRRRLAKVYLSRELGTEAVSTLQAMLDEDRHLNEDPEFQVLMGAALYLADEFDKAQKYFEAIEIEGDSEIDLWLGFLRANDETKEKRNYEAFKNGYMLIGDYPYSLKRSFVFSGVELALKQKDTETARSLMSLLDGLYLNRTDEDKKNYYHGKINEVAGKVHHAIEIWKELIAAHKEKKYNQMETEGQVLAKLGILELRIKNNEIQLPDAIEEFEKLRFAWRGDKHEQAILQTLAELYEKDNNILQALLNLRRLQERFPNKLVATTARAKMSELFFQSFEKARQEGGMTPMSALALYKEFGDLIPRGEAGLEIVEYIINQLLQADLLEDATQLLEKRLLRYLVGEEKVEAILKIANLYILNKQGPEALKLVNNISLKEFRKSNLQDQIIVTKAQSLVLLGQLKQAIHEMEKVNTKEAKSLRSEIFLKLEEWDKARINLENIIELDQADPNVNIDELLDLASVYVILNDEKSLTQLKRTYQPIIEKSPYKDKFQMLYSSPIGETQDPKEYLKEIKNVDAYLQLYSEYREKSA